MISTAVKSSARAARRSARILLPLGLGLLAVRALPAAPRRPAEAAPAVRVRTTLETGWSVRLLEEAEPDISALTRAAAAPDGSWMSARMPAQVHEILLAHGRIPDPRVGRNAAESAWVGERDWVYACRFATPPHADGPVFLRFEGLDTLADAYVNGTLVGRFDDMYRRYAVDVRDRLAPAGAANTLLIRFRSALRHLETLRRPPGDVLPAFKYLRKCSSDFGSYLGARPHSVKVGVFRPVVLDVPGTIFCRNILVNFLFRLNYRFKKRMTILILMIIV